MSHEIYSVPTTASELHAGSQLSSQFSPLPHDQLQQVSGGLGFSVDISQMPDRTVGCGTMWVLDQIFRPFFPPRM